MDAQKKTVPSTARLTRHGVKMDFEGKIPLRQRIIMRLTSSSFWIDRVWYLVRFVLMVGISYVIIYPFLSKILESVMALQDFSDPTVSMIPKHFTTKIYYELAVDKHYLTVLLNTTLLSAVTALIQTFICCMIGYGLAKFRFKGNKLIFALVIVTMAIPHSTLRYALFRHFEEFDIMGLQFLNFGDFKWKGIFELVTGKALYLGHSYAPFIILSATGLAFKNGLYIFMMRQFFQGVPDELEESAYVDGSGTFRTFFRIILPLSVPMMITIFLFAFSWQWTDNFYTQVFYPITKPDLMLSLISDVPKALEVNSAYLKTVYYEAVKNTGGLMVIAPLVVIYLFGQRYLVEGIERSGITG